MHRRVDSRRQFLKTLGLGALTLSAARPGKAAPAPDRRPNVLIVLTDDQGFGDVRSHGNDLIDTPVMDRLAASGARFDRFYVSPVCAPTRAALLTGRYPHRSGVYGVTRREEVMRSEEVTIAEILKRAGYATGCFGKWHNGAQYPFHPNGQGFDEFLGFCAGHWNNYFDTTLERNGRPVKTKGYITDVLTDAALAFIEQNKSRPFLCYVPYNAPHAPFQVPDNYFDKYKARGLDDPVAAAYGMIENVDDNLGRLLAKLDALDLAGDTIVMLLGDNGANWDRFNAGMRARKGSTHEGGVRSPLFVRWPGRITPGTTVKQIAAHIDLLPTLVDLTGVAMPKTLPLDGRSLAPLLDGDTVAWPDRMLFWHWRNRGAVRTQRHRLVIEKSRAQLYDIVADPGEARDMAQAEPDLTRKLKTAYDAWLEDVTRTGSVPPPIPIGYGQMPCVELSAHEGHLEGGLQYHGEKGWANDWVTHWTSTDGQVSWDVDVIRAGTYAVSLMYTCPAQDVGAKVCVEIGGRRVAGVLDKAHDPEPVNGPDRYPRWEVYEKVWAPLELGAVALPKGPSRLVVRALTKPGNAVMDLKAVRVQQPLPAQ